MTRILIVEDDESLGRALSNLLGAEGYAADLVGSGEDALTVLPTEPYSVIILDIGLPDRSGLDILKSLRRAGDAIPVLVLTARDAITDRVQGLDDGADDYVSKPFASSELVARVRALIRRGSGETFSKLTIGALTCDPAAQTADVNGRRLELPRREWMVLYNLVTQSGKVVPRERLAAQVFAFDDDVGPNALEVYITRLRKKLAPDGPQIRNMRGLGYIIGP